MIVLVDNEQGDPISKLGGINAGHHFTAGSDRDLISSYSSFGGSEL